MNLICTICREELCGESLGRVCCIPCGHVFHDGCIFFWLQRSQTCPHCRVITMPDKIMKLYFEILIEDEDGEDNHEEEARILELQLNEVKTALDNTKTELRLKCQDVNTLTKKFNEITTVNDSLRYESNVLHARVKDLRSMITDYEKQKQELTSAINALHKDQQKMVHLTNEVQKYQMMKKLLDGSVKEADEVVNGENLEIDTLKVCYLSMKRNFQTAILSEAKAKSDFGQLFVSYKNLEKANAVLNERLSIKDRIIESYKAELQIASKRSFPVENSPGPGPSAENLEEVVIETPPKKRIALRRLNREATKRKVISTLIVNKKSSKKVQETYDGLGGHSKEDKFPNAKLKACKIVSNRKK